MGVATLLKQTGLVASSGEGMRMIDQGAVRIDGERITDRKLSLPAGERYLVQVGKRKFANVELSLTS